MHIILVYATNSGSTYLVGQLIKEVLEKNHAITVKTAAETNLADFKKADLIILGSPSWYFDHKEGYPHETMMHLISKLRGENFSYTKFAIYGCGDSSYTYLCGAVDHLEKWVAEIQGQKIVDSLRIDGFYFDEEKNSRLVTAWAEELSKKI